jgi:hypothetical protein
MTQKDLQINIVQKQLLDCEDKLQRERQALVEIKRMQGNMEMDYETTYKDFDRQLKEKEETVERLRKDSEY